MYRTARVYSQWIAVLAAVSYYLVPYTPSASVSIAGKAIFITQFLIALAFLLSSVRLFYEVRELRARHRRISSVSPLFVLSALISGVLLVLLASTVVSGGIAPGRILSIATIGVVIVIVACLTRRFIDRLLAASAAVSALASVLGILQFYVYGDRLSPAAYLGHAATTFYASGFANLPSLFGASLALFVPVFFALFLLRYKGWTLLWAAAFFLGVPALVLTFSRSALLGTAVGVVIVALYLYFRYAHKRRVIALSLLAAVAMAAGAVLYTPPESLRSDGAQWYGQTDELFRERAAFLSLSSSGKGDSEMLQNDKPTSFIPNISVTDPSAYSRVVFLRMSWDMLTDSPRRLLFGWGVEGFRDNWERFKPDTFVSTRPYGAHSLFSEIAVSGGLAALGLFLAFLALLYRALWRLRRQEMLAVPLIAGLSGILIDGIFHTHLYTKYLWIEIGVALALVLAHRRERCSADRIPAPRSAYPVSDTGRLRQGDGILSVVRLMRRAGSTPLLMRVKPERIERPWGVMWKLVHTRRFWLKLIRVRGRTSRQSHERRAELHIGTRGISFIRAGQEHRMERGLYLECAFGRPEESDITRYEDDYGRA